MNVFLKNAINFFCKGLTIGVKIRRTPGIPGVDIITDADGKKLVLINDIHFKGKRQIDWD